MTCPQDRERILNERQESLRLEADRLRREADPAELDRLVAEGLAVVRGLIARSQIPAPAPTPD